MQITKPQLEDIQPEIEQALRSLAEKRGDQIVVKIRPVLAANLDRGRIQAFSETKSIGEYVERVADHYESLSPLITKLQSDRTVDVWEPLSKKLQVWAYNFLIRKNFSAGQATKEIAMECANTAAITILEAHFPFDTDFEAWAHVIVLNTCRKFFRNETKKSIIPPQLIIELDETLIGVDDSILTRQKSQEDNSDILKAITQLSKTRRQVIELYYLEEIPLPEIAKMLGKSVGAIHSLHFNALQDLRKILGTNRDND